MSLYQASFRHLAMYSDRSDDLWYANAAETLSHCGSEQALRQATAVQNGV